MLRMKKSHHRMEIHNKHSSNDVLILHGLSNPNKVVVQTFHSNKLFVLALSLKKGTTVKFPGMFSLQ